MRKLLVSSMIILLSVGSLKAEELSKESHSADSSNSEVKPETAASVADPQVLMDLMNVDVAANNESTSEEAATDNTAADDATTDEATADEATADDSANSGTVSENENSTTAEGGADPMVAPPGGRGGHHGGGGFRSGGGYHRGGGGFRSGGGFHRGGSFRGGFDRGSYGRGGYFRGGHDRGSFGRSRYGRSSRGGFYFGGYRSRPGFHSGWRWNRSWRPNWWLRGLHFPSYTRYSTIPYNYYQCVAFDRYMNAYYAGGRTANEAAYNALYTCGGYTYDYNACYIPTGYCRIR